MDDAISSIDDDTSSAEAAWSLAELLICPLASLRRVLADDIFDEHSEIDLIIILMLSERFAIEFCNSPISSLESDLRIWTARLPFEISLAATMPSLSGVIIVRIIIEAVMMMIITEIISPKITINLVEKSLPSMSVAVSLTIAEVTSWILRQSSYPSRLFWLILYMLANAILEFSMYVSASVKNLSYSVLMGANSDADTLLPRRFNTFEISVR